MRNIWGKIKGFFSRIWQGLTWAGRIIIGIILIVLIALAIYALTNNKKDEDTNKDGPEVAQVYEPSIGSPLPATTTPSDSTTNASTTTASTDKAGTVAGDSTASSSQTDMMLAPATGIDPNEPITYENPNLLFTAILPAGSNVDESNTEKIIFTSQTRKLLYIVSTSKAENESIADLQNQLKNSSSVSSVRSATFAGLPALSFTATDYGNGLVFIDNGRIYYLLGNNQYFSDFKV